MQHQRPYFSLTIKACLESLSLPFFFTLCNFFSLLDSAAFGSWHLFHQKPDSWQLSVIFSLPFHEGLLNHINCLQRHTFSVVHRLSVKVLLCKEANLSHSITWLFSDCLTMFPFCCPSSSGEGYYFWNFSSLFKSLFDFFFVTPSCCWPSSQVNLCKSWLTIRIQCYECNIPECFVCRED